LVVSNFIHTDHVLPLVILFLLLLPFFLFFLFFFHPLFLFFLIYSEPFIFFFSLLFNLSLLLLLSLLSQSFLPLLLLLLLLELMQLFFGQLLVRIIELSSRIFLDIFIAVIFLVSSVPQPRSPSSSLSHYFFPSTLLLFFSSHIHQLIFLLGILVIFHKHEVIEEANERQGKRNEHE